MKKLFTLLTMLVIGISGMWAATLTLVTKQDTWSGGTFYMTSGSSTSNWGHTYLSSASSSQPQVFINSGNGTSGGFNCANGRHSAGKTFYMNIQPGYKITGYKITFKSTGSSTTITAADGTTQTADGSTTQTLNVNGLSTLNTSYSVSGSNAILTSYQIYYEAAGGTKYRLVQHWKNDPSYTYYCYANSSQSNYMFETNTPQANKFGSDYVWLAENSSCKLMLKNLATSHYVKQFSGTNSDFQLLNATTTGGAEKIKIAINFNYGNFYTLQSTSAGSASYIDSYSAGGKVNIHNALHQGDIFRFVPVKTVNFVDGNSADKSIPVTCGGGTTNFSTIYVATDGSDSFTLPDGYVYTFGGTTYTATSAATAIAAAGTDDITVTVNHVITDLSNISNSKKYKIICNRGGLSTYKSSGTTYLASTAKTALNLEAKEFAIINYNSKYYLYSVSDKKIVTYQSETVAPLVDDITGTTSVIAFVEKSSGSGIYGIRFNNESSKNLNSYDHTDYPYAIAINDYTTWDNGNQYVIEEVDDFDPKEALGIISGYNNIISQLKSINWGSPKGQLNHYNFINAFAGYAGNESDIIESYEDQGYSEENLALVQGFINNYSLNVPEAGKFYRIQGNTSSKYLAAGLASNDRFTMKTPADISKDATTVFYYDGTILTNLSSGMCNGTNKDDWAWTVNTSASTVTFLDANTNGGYGIQSKDIYFYDDGDGTGSADRGAAANVDIQSTSLNERYRKWYLTEITSLPVTFNSAAMGYATFNCPVALKVPSGVEAYVCKLDIDKNTIKLYQADQIKDGDDCVLPAGTPVLLYNKDFGTDDTKLFTVASATDEYEHNGFIGTVAAEIPDYGNYLYYALRKKSSSMGFYQRSDQTAALTGFRAWIAVPKTSGARNFTIEFDGDSDSTGIVEALGLENDNVEIYDLNGRKLSSYQNGINIVNGKKIFK